MTVAPTQIRLELHPAARLDVIDVTSLIRSDLDEFFDQYRKTLYCSYHTTAGYLEQSLSARLDYSRDRLGSFLGLFQQLFPAGADYEHDNLDQRSELSPAQRQVEPRNADSHLAFMSSGLENCVTYNNHDNARVHFIDLDGVHEHGSRTRHTTALGYNQDVVEAEDKFAVPVSRHPIDSINLREDRLGFFEWLQELVTKHGIQKGRIDIALDPAETQSGLTVNEYETLLMRHDLVDVLKDPLRFVASQGRDFLGDPRGMAHKTLSYATYDFVHVLNELMDKTGISESIIERVLARFMAMPANRFLRMKRAVSLLITDEGADGNGTIVQGTYQSPVLVQWNRASGRRRRLNVQVVRFA